MRARGGGRRLRALAASCAAALLLAAAPAPAQEPVPKDEAAAEPAPSPPEAPKESSFRWVFSWRGWDGLYMELAQKTPFGRTAEASGEEPPDTWSVPILSLEEVKLAGRIGGRLEGDAAAFLTSGGLTGFDDGFALRRARLVLAGDCILLVPFSYRIEMGYVPNAFNLSEAWLAFPNIAYVGTLKTGQFQSPMGLDLITSSLSIPLMEPAAPLQAIAPGTQAGIQIGKSELGGRATWRLGIFGNGAGTEEYGSATKGYGTAIGRATWLAIDTAGADDSPASPFLHVGLSLSYQFASSGAIQYRSRPESHIAPYVIDTGPITSSGVETVGVEAAWVNGPFYAQAEGIHSYVQAADGTSLGFGGYYAVASWALTGESRTYDRLGGAVQRIVPRRNFRFGKGEGRGALEVAVRYSYTDLNDKWVHGGRLSLLMSGITWTPLPHVRWLVNAGYGTVTGGPADGHMAIFQTRIGIDL
jgi:phosphate-selective porin OprO and OprP